MLMNVYFMLLMVFVLQKNAHVCHIRRSVAAQVSVVPRLLLWSSFDMSLGDADYRVQAVRLIISVRRLGPPITEIITFIIYTESAC